MLFGSSRRGFLLVCSFVVFIPCLADAQLGSFSPQPIANLFNSSDSSDFFDSTVSQIVSSVENDAISLSGFDGGEPISVAELCSILVERHSSGISFGQHFSNERFLACYPVSIDDCIDALENPSGLAADGWSAWAGRHDGAWYSDNPDAGGPWSDGATWQEPKPTRDGGSKQDVDFDDKRGDSFNQSHPDNGYVTGYDPKGAGGADGVHVGFPFNIGHMSCIVWLTPKNAFLECICEGRKTSTDIGYGRGHWLVTEFREPEPVRQTALSSEVSVSSGD